MFSSNSVVPRSSWLHIPRPQRHIGLTTTGVLGNHLLLFLLARAAASPAFIATHPQRFHAIHHRVHRGCALLWRGFCAKPRVSTGGPGHRDLELDLGAATRRRAAEIRASLENEEGAGP